MIGVTNVMTDAVSAESSRSHVNTNRASWDATADEYQREHQPQLSVDPMKWGVWGVPERELQALGDVDGKDVLELGCGAAQWSIELAQLGARPVGIDLSERQLSHARRFVGESSVRVPLAVADAEHLPFANSAFDLVFCDYGAMTFADPYATVPEVARILRSGGYFTFLTTSPLFLMCEPEGAEHPQERLTGDYFDMHRFRFEESGGIESVEFQLPYGEWIRLFRRSGFVIDALMEPRPVEGAQSTYRTPEDLAWARRWPMECLWRVRLE
jgi:SAM-dependent methyltransferase